MLSVGYCKSGGETMEIKKATVIQGTGTDKVYLATNLPDPCWPFRGTLSLSFHAEAGSGERYVKDYFGIDVQVIKTRE